MTHLDQLKWFYYNHIKSIRTLLLLVGCIGIINSILGVLVIPNQVKQLESMVIPVKKQVTLVEIANPNQAIVDAKISELQKSFDTIPPMASHMSDQEKLTILLKKYKLESDSMVFTSVKQDTPKLIGKGLNLKVKGNYENIRKFMIEVSNSFKHGAVLDYSLTRFNIGDNGISASVNLILYYFSNS